MPIRPLQPVKRPCRCGSERRERAALQRTPDGGCRTWGDAGFSQPGRGWNRSPGTVSCPVASGPFPGSFVPSRVGDHNPSEGHFFPGVQVTPFGGWRGPGVGEQSGKGAFPGRETPPRSDSIRAVPPFRAVAAAGGYAMIFRGKPGRDQAGRGGKGAIPTTARRVVRHVPLVEGLSSREPGNPEVVHAPPGRDNR